MKIDIKNKAGFSLVELIVALAVFAVLAAGVFYVVTNSYSNFYGSGDKQSLSEYAQEGIEAARAIRNNSWQDIVDAVGSNGITQGSDGLWTFSGSSDTQDALTRVVTIANVERDANGNIVDSGGTEDPSTKKVTVTVSANGISDYVLYTYLTDWSYKTWEQTTWSGSGDYEFWVDDTMGSSSYSNISTSTSGQLELSLAAAGTAFSWNALSDLTVDSSFLEKPWDDFYNFQLGPDGKSLYVVGTSNFDYVKFDISRAQAGIFSPEWKIEVPWHMQVAAAHPNGNYAYLGRRAHTNGTDAVCVADIAALNLDSINDCYDLTMTGASVYPNVMLINQAADRLYVLDNFGYAYTFQISGDGSTLTLTNPGQLIAGASGTSYSLNQAYLDESGVEPYIYMVSDASTGEFRKLGFDGDFYSSTSTYAYVDSSFVYDINDISFIGQVGGKNRFVLAVEDSTKELITVEDQGTSLTQLGYYNLSTSQSYAQVDHDGGTYAVIGYYSPGGLYAVDISDLENPADGSMSNTTFSRRSNYITYDQLVYSTTSHGFFVNDHVASDNSTGLHFIGRSMTRATGGQYNYKRKITLGQNSKVSGGPHTDFPIVVAESQDYLKTTTNGGKVENDYGYDIIFTSDSDGDTVLDHEIEYYSSSTGELVAWVKIPSLSSNTDIYMFYGNSDISSTQEDISGVWSNDYSYVSHMVDSGYAGTRSSVHSSGGGFKKSHNGPTQATHCKIGPCQLFDGVDDYIYMEYNYDLNQGYADFTAEAWAYPDSSFADSYSSVMYFGNGGVNGQDGWLMRFYNSTDKVYFHMGDDNLYNLGGIYLQNAAINNDAWNYLAVTVDRDVGYQGYVDNVAGNSYATNTEANFIGGVYDVGIGKDWSSTDYFWQGYIDEVRISSTTRSTDWMTTGYNNMYATSTFYTVYSEESAGGYAPSGSFYSSIYNIGSSDKDLRTITVEQEIPSGCSLQITLEAADNAAMSNAASEVFSDSSTTLYTSSTPVALDGKKYLRYKVDLASCNSNSQTPVLYSLKLNYK